MGVRPPTYQRPSPIPTMIKRSSQNNPSNGGSTTSWLTPGGWRQLLPTAHQHTTVTCYDDLGHKKTHGTEQRYVSPTTGVCRKLLVQAVHPHAPNECPIADHAGHVSKQAVWLLSTNPFRHGVFWKWIWTWFWFTFKLLWSFIWLIASIAAALFLQVDLSDDAWDDSEVYNTGYYKPYVRGFRGQLWEARSKKEYSTRVRSEDKKEAKIITHSLYPRLIMIHDPTRDEWSPCTEASIITTKKYLAISYRAADVYSPGPNQEKEKADFTHECRVAALQQNFDAYWLDLECVGETQDEKNLDVYCMADVYRGAESTLIMLGNSEDGEQAAWERWGGRVWTFPEALLSQRLFYKFRDGSEINPVSLHQVANLAYSRAEHGLEKAIVNAYGTGKDPLERLERLTLLKSAIWRRGISVASTPALVPLEPPASQTSVPELVVEKVSSMSGPHAAERVYALMGFFDHRIKPNYAEDELRALVRLSMANDNDRIAERMVSLLPTAPHQDAHWYAEDDVYEAELWDIIPEIQVAGVTEHGALVLDGCRAASIRWKDFPEVAFDKSDSVRRTVIGFLPFLSWPLVIVGIAAVAAGFSIKGGIALLVIGIVLLFASPKLFVFSEGGRVVDAQPWFIGVKGVLDIDSAAEHLYGGANMGHYPRVEFSPSGSEFAMPEEGSSVREGSRKQYNKAKEAEAAGRQMFTLIDTWASIIYYFSAARPPTVCLFTGREGGLGRFALCSERCYHGELHKESVLRMPTEVSQKMEMCGWVALG